MKKEVRIMQEIGEISCDEMTYKFITKIGLNLTEVFEYAQICASKIQLLYVTSQYSPNLIRGILEVTGEQQPWLMKIDYGIDFVPTVSIAGTGKEIVFFYYSSSSLNLPFVAVKVKERKNGRLVSTYCEYVDAIELTLMQIMVEGDRHSTKVEIKIGGNKGEVYQNMVERTCLDVLYDSEYTNILHLQDYVLGQERDFQELANQCRLLKETMTFESFQYSNVKIVVDGEEISTT